MGTARWTRCALGSLLQGSWSKAEPWWGCRLGAALCRPLQKGFAPSSSPECVSLPASRCRFMNHRVPSNCRYQPTEYEHAANCATHAVSPCPCPWVREGGAHLSGDPLRNLKGHLKMSVFCPGAATETLRAVMRQMCPVSSWGLGCSPSSCPGKLMCIPLALTHHGHMSLGNLAVA